MAKQKIPTQEMTQEEGVGTFQESSQEQTSEQKTEQEDSVQNGEPDVESADTDTQVDTPKPKQETSPSNEKREKKQETKEPDGYILGILKSYPQYQSLYVDRLGGVFTPDTSARIRGGATLYKNPYYKQN